MVYPALLSLMRTPRLPVVDWTDTPRGFKLTRPFRRKTKSNFCASAITFQLASTIMHCTKELSATQLPVLSAPTSLCLSPSPSPNFTPSPVISFCSNSLPQSFQPFYLSCFALPHSQFSDDWDAEMCRRTCIGADEVCYACVKLHYTVSRYKFVE